MVLRLRVLRGVRVVVMPAALGPAAAAVLPPHAAGGVRAVRAVVLRVLVRVLRVSVSVSVRMRRADLSVRAVPPLIAGAREQLARAEDVPPLLCGCGGDARAM